MCLSTVCNTHFSQLVLFPLLQLMGLYFGHAGVLRTICYEAIKAHCHRSSKKGLCPSLEQLHFTIRILRHGTAEITSLLIQLTGRESITTKVTYN